MYFGEKGGGDGEFTVLGTPLEISMSSRDYQVSCSLLDPTRELDNVCPSFKHYGHNFKIVSYLELTVKGSSKKVFLQTH